MSPKTCGFGILGIGMYAPPDVLTNADLEKMVDTTDEWIVSRTGIKERHKLAEDKATSDMAVIAAERALEDAGTRPEEIDLIICGTFSPDVTVPCMATMIQARLGIPDRGPVFDLNAACTGFTYGLTIATGLMRAGLYKKALVIGADAVTRFVDYTKRDTCILFGDGSGAAIVGETGTDRGLVSEFLGADGALGPELVLHDSGTKIRTPEEKAAYDTSIYMNGKEIFKFATKVMGDAMKGALEASGQGLRVEDLHLLIPHQANLRIIESAAKRMGIPMEKVYVNIQKYGNTSAASIPMALVEAREEGRFKSGDLLGLVAFGGGVTYGASVWVW